ncbi:MAG: DNA alkylation repair protein [Verrucomicrobia bacterium]|nr:DNA alkylation repair protein [Verrucomicrobiota bacterium]
MNLDDVMKELAAKANPQCKRTYLRHGAAEPLFGVRIGDLKPLQKKLKGRQELALELFATGNSDAMYLAGLIADGSRMTRQQLDRWASGATWHMIAGYSVAWFAAEHPLAVEIASQWIDSPKECVAIAGRSTLGSVLATVPDERLPIKELSAALDRCAKSIKTAPNRVRYAMNHFVICVGTYVQPLGDKALATARKIGQVEVDMGQTDCQVPDAESYILKSRRGAPIAPKRKTTRC